MQEKRSPLGLNCEAERSLHFVCALPPRRPLRPARTVPGSKVHRTFSLTVTPFKFDSCSSFVREKKRTTAFYAVVLFFLMVEVARHHPLSRKRGNGLTFIWISCISCIPFHCFYGLLYPSIHYHTWSKSNKLLLPVLSSLLLVLEN